MNLSQREQNIKIIGYAAALGDLQAWVLKNVTEYDTRTLRALNAEIARLNAILAAEKDTAA